MLGLLRLDFLKGWRTILAGALLGAAEIVANMDGGATWAWALRAAAAYLAGVGIDGKFREAATVAAKRVVPMLLAVVVLAGCAIVGKVDDVTLDAHADAVEAIAAENSTYIAADPALQPEAKTIRTHRNEETARFARKLAETR